MYTGMTTILDKLFGTFLGVEFKEDSVVVTYLRNSMSGIHLLSSSEFQIIEKDNDRVAHEIREYINKNGTNINRVFVSIPDNWALTKFTDIPSLKGKGRSAVVNLMKFEIERHIPFPVEDVFYDFLVMHEKDMTNSVVFVAVQKEKVDFIKDFLEKLALHPYAITISSFAVLNTIELSGVPVGGWQEFVGITRKSDVLGKKGETNISICIDKTNASLAIISNGLCTHLRTFMFNPDEQSEVFLDDIAKYLAEAQSRLSIEHFQKIIINGDISSIPGLIDELKEKLKIVNITVNQITIFKGNLEGVNMNGLASSVGACFAGLGVGTYRINILPHKKEYEIKKAAPLTTKIFLVLILVMVIGIFATEAVKQRKFLLRMEEALNKNEPEIHALEKISSDMNVLKSRSDFLHKIEANEITLEILAELTSILPKDSWVTNLNFKGLDINGKKNIGGELIISGYAASSSTLIPLLEDSPYFEKVEFVGTIKKRREKEQFKLSAQVVIPFRQGSEQL